MEASSSAAPRRTVRPDARAVPEESWADEVRGTLEFRTLIDQEVTPTDSLTAGLSEVPPGGRMGRHRHEPAELYHVLEGEGVVEIDGEEHVVRRGATVFLPGGCWHSVRNLADEPFRVFYVFAVDSFAEVSYEFASCPRS